jgi:hypothetical protein
MTSSDEKLSFDDFKRWIKHNNQEQSFKTDKRPNGLIGVTVESKIAIDRLFTKITPLDDLDAEEDLAYEFIEHGGKITEVDGKRFLIEVTNGAFYIHRCYVTRS